MFAPKSLYADAEPYELVIFDLRAPDAAERYWSERAAWLEAADVESLDENPPCLDRPPRRCSGVGGVRPLEKVLDRLDGTRQPNGSWKATCPAHADKIPSLSISEGDDGRALLNCFAGCETEDVLAALGLGMATCSPSGTAERGRGV